MLKNYVGIVLDNKDPKRIGRCKVRVISFFDTLPVEDIPWATPWKDPNGNQFIIPDVGKVVSVHFDSDNIYKPEYIYSESYNVNLERKLQNIDESDYITMRALMFDHKTQIYSNDSEGLVVDHKYNKLNIKEEGINLELKDNFSKVNIGSKTANQQAILGNHFLDWMEEFLNILQSVNGPAFLDSNGAPIVPSPEIYRSILKFISLKNPKFLSHHVNLVDNNSVDTWNGPLSKSQIRVDTSQIGDDWKSTKESLSNNLTKIEDPISKPVFGNTTDPVVSSDGGSLTTVTDESGEFIQTDSNSVPEIIKSENPDVEIILRTMRRKGYQILERPWELNIVGIRKKSQGERYSNSFEDKLYVIYRVDGNQNWQFKNFKISTIPGYYKALEVRIPPKDDKPERIALKPSGYRLKSGESWAGNTPDGKAIDVKLTSVMVSRGGMGILKEAQYKKIYKIGIFNGDESLVVNYDKETRGKQKFYRDSSSGDTIKYTKEGEGSVGMYVHKGFSDPPGSGLNVSNWSEGCQVFSSKSEINDFIKICRVHEQKYGNYFNYTLMLERDLS
jgi:hypothetical protein